MRELRVLIRGPCRCYTSGGIAIRSCCSLSLSFCVGRRVEPYSAIDVCCDHGDLIRVAESEMGVCEDEKVGEGGGEGEIGGEGCPGARICVDDDGEEGGRLLCGCDLVVLGLVDSVHGG